MAAPGSLALEPIHPVEVVPVKIDFDEGAEARGCAEAAQNELLPQVLLGMVSDGERLLARWLREAAASDRPPEAREFSVMVLCIYRLIATRKALREILRDVRQTQPCNDPEDPEAFEERLCAILERIEAGRTSADDPDALPD